jgi:prepilin-type N-terminal cleavage/methylation domain-containing protein
MISPRLFTRRAARHGFTLVEVMLAVAILSFIILGLSEILILSSQTLRRGFSQTSSFSRGRVVLDAISTDIARGVFRPDLPNFPPSNTTPPSFTFYTRLPGPGSGMRNVSQVTDQLSSSQPGYLLRSQVAVSWLNNPTFIFQQALVPARGGSSTLPPPVDLLSQGVVDLEMVFIRADGTSLLASKYTPPATPAPVVTGSNPVIMVGVAVAVMDDETATILTQANAQNFTLLQTALESTLTSGPFTATPCTQRSIKSLWDASFTPAFFSRYPKPLAGGLRTFESFVPCTPFN